MTYHVACTAALSLHPELHFRTTILSRSLPCTGNHGHTTSDYQTNIPTTMWASGSHMKAPYLVDTGRLPWHNGARPLISLAMYSLRPLYQKSTPLDNGPEAVADTRPGPRLSRHSSCQQVVLDCGAPSTRRLQAITSRSVFSGVVAECKVPFVRHGRLIMFYCSSLKLK